LVSQNMNQWPGTSEMSGKAVAFSEGAQGRRQCFLDGPFQTIYLKVLDFPSFLAGGFPLATSADIPPSIHLVVDRGQQCPTRPSGAVVNRTVNYSKRNVVNPDVVFIMPPAVRL
jgi:hypothetical protein